MVARQVAIAAHNAMARGEINEDLIEHRSLSLLLATGSATAAAKPDIVLVHGAWEEANIWQAVTPLLEKDGYRVVTVTLPGVPVRRFRRTRCRSISIAIRS